MREKAATHSKPKSSGFLSYLIFLVFKIALLSLLAWVMLIIWFGVQWFLRGDNSALTQANSILQLNMNFIEDSHTWLSSLVIHWVEVVHRVLMNIAQAIDHVNFQPLQTSVKLGLIISEIVTARLFIYILTMPLFGLIFMVFMTDGLVKRDIRKFQGARESTFTFHRLKLVMGFLFFIPMVIYLSFPFAINPILFLIIQGVFLGVVAQLSITYFKKYV